MMLATAHEFVVVLVDLQKRLMPAIDDSARVLAQAVRLANIARLLDIPVIGTEQNPERLGENVDDIKRLCDSTLVKTHFDACADGLVAALPPDRPKVLVAGCEAHVCVLQTVAGLLGHGREVWLAADALGSRRGADRKAALARLHEAGVRLATVEMMAFEWMRHSNHPRFREVLSFIK